MIASTLRRQASLAVGAIALTALSGCSLAFVDAPPRDHASRHFFDCTTSLLAPGLDATLAGILALSMVGEASDGSHHTTTVVDTSLALAGALASATYGYLKVSRCREAKEALAARLLEVPYAGVPPWDPSRAAPPPGALPTTPPVVDGAPTNAPASRDPWLSEGPPPPSYLRLAPQIAQPIPPPPAGAIPPLPPETAVPPASPAPINPGTAP